MRNVNAPIDSLEDFSGWDSQSPEEDFFAELERSDDSTFESEPEVGTGEGEVGVDSEDDTPIESDLFQDFNDDDDDEIIEDDEEDIKGEGVEPQSKAVLSYLKERGLISFEEDEDYEDEDPEHLIEDKFQEALDNKVKDLFEELPDVVKQLNSYVLKGGDINSFLKEVTKSSSQGISETMDIESEKDQETIVRETMKADDNDPEIIEAQIEFLKDSGKLGLFAKRDFNRWKKNSEKARQDLVNKQKEREEQAKIQIRQTKKRMSEYLSSNETIGSISLDRSDIKDIPSYINDRSVKLQNGSYISQLQKELYYDLPQNEEAYLQLAALMRNRNEDGTFNFKAIQEGAATKVSKEIKDNVRRKKNSLPGRNRDSNVNLRAKTLADYFKTGK